MKKYFIDKLERFRLIAFLEGLSFLLLLGIAMPLKYMWGQPWLVENIGMIHGLLFILYIFMTIQLKFELDWSWRKTLLAMLASIVPFGTFWVTAKLLPKLANS